MNESAPSAKDIALYRLFGQANHPCNYFDLAKEAFLKCFGLGYDSENSSNKKKHGTKKDWLIDDDDDDIKCQFIQKYQNQNHLTLNSWIYLANFLSLLIQLYSLLAEFLAPNSKPNLI